MQKMPPVADCGDGTQEQFPVRAAYWLIDVWCCGSSQPRLHPAPDWCRCLWVKLR